MHTCDSTSLHVPCAIELRVGGGGLCRIHLDGGWDDAPASSLVSQSVESAWDVVCGAFASMLVWWRRK